MQQLLSFLTQSLKAYPENNPRPRLVGVESDAGPDWGAFEVFLSMNFPNIPDISRSLHEILSHLKSTLIKQSNTQFHFS